MVFSIGLGIAVDDSIHFLSAYTHRRRTISTAAAITYAYRTAGRSMLDTSIVLVAGFSAVAFSEFQGFLLLGTLTAWGGAWWSPSGVCPGARHHGSMKVGQSSHDRFLTTIEKKMGETL